MQPDTSGQSPRSLMTDLGLFLAPLQFPGSLNLGRLVFPGREGIFCGFQGEAGYAFCAGLAYIMLCKLSCVGSSYEPCIV